MTMEKVDLLTREKFTKDFDLLINAIQEIFTRDSSRNGKFERSEIFFVIMQWHSWMKVRAKSYNNYFARTK